MMRRSATQQRLLSACAAGLIAALYTVLTVIVGAFGLANGAIQLRVSEALCVLPFFLPAAIPGLTVGCLLSNLLLGALWQDVIFGTLATLIGAIGTYLLRRTSKWLLPIPTVVANTVIVPFVLAYAYGAEDGLWFLMLTVGLGEVLSAYVLGMVFFAALSRRSGIFAGFSRGERASARSESFAIEPPDPVREAIEMLEGAGFEAYAVGGCVRDSIIGRAPNDWDINTSARPEETARVFASYRTVETGIKHGTLTVLIGGMSLEITTFRCDGEYLDNRHPASVTFARRVEDDLSRRDFTVNAMAYHPRRGLVDLFGGREDLSRRRIACVGDAKTRFEEDGLRILRAIRFASVLDFEIEERTAEAIHSCRALLANIAAERLREELCKLICGVGAIRILREYHDVIEVFIPEFASCVGFAQNTKYHCYDVYEHTLHALEQERDGDLCTRLAILLHDIGKPRCYTEDEQGGHFKGHGAVGTEMTDEILSRLRFDNETRERVVRLCEYHDREIPAEARSVKRLMRVFSDEDILRLMEVKRCDRVAHAEGYNVPSEALAAIPQTVKAIREADACISLRTLAVKGDDLMAIGIPKGREIGRILSELLDSVMDEALPNEREALLEAARKMK